MKYDVCFTRYLTFRVEAEDEDEAIDEAEKCFNRYQRIPIADTSYDYVEVEEVE